MEFNDNDNQTNISNIENHTSNEKNDLEIKQEELNEKNKLLKTKNERLNKIKQKIDKFKKLECIELYKIIKNNNQKYSQNKNSILFDLMKIDESTIQKIEQFINYIDNNNVIMQENEKTKNILKLICNK